MGRLGVACMGVAPMLADDVRKALAANEDLRALERLTKRGWKIASDGRSTTGRRGPAWDKAFSARVKP